MTDHAQSGDRDHEFRKAYRNKKESEDKARKDEELRLTNVARKWTTADNDTRPPAANRLIEQDLYRVADSLRRSYPNTKLYTLVYASKDFHNTPFPYCYLVQKPKDCKLHPGLWNFPGGKIDAIPQIEKPSNEDGPAEVECEWEKPADGALRELQEETGLTGTFPILCGLIAPPPTPDHMKDVDSLKDPLLPPPYLVYCFKAIITGTQLPNEDVQLRKITDSFQWKDVVPNIPLLAALFYANVQGWILQEPDFRETPHAYEGKVLFTNPTSPYRGYNSP